MYNLALGLPWNPDRPHILVITCSDGRLQEATDQFLTRALHIRHYDRLYMPGGAGAMASTSMEPRAKQFREDCQFLVEAHQVEHLILLFHGPAANGPKEALCADYLRKFPSMSAERVRAQQAADVRDLLARRHEFAGDAMLALYRLEVDVHGMLGVVPLHEDAPELVDRLLTEDAPPPSWATRASGEVERRATPRD